MKEKLKQKIDESGREVPKRRSRLSAKERKRLSRLLHQRIHYGKTYPIIKALRERYGDDFVEFDDPCDACMWAKAKALPVKKNSRRKARRFGDRLHYDLFISPWRSDSGCKYMLVVVDEYSSYVWGFGLRKKNETMMIMKSLIVEIEKMMSMKVKSVERMSDDYVDEGVSSVRCDNAKENVMNKMKKWCRDRGTKLETTIPHTSHQNGRAERMGGVVWAGGAALRYGGNLPNTDWLHCCLAYIHIRNRLPNNCDKKDKRTAFEIMYDVSLPMHDLIDHFRTIGCICYVVPPSNIYSGKPKASFRAIMMGYCDQDGKKGYKVRRLCDGKLMNVARERVYRFYEMSLAYPPLPDYDAWLKKSIRVRDSKIEKERNVNYDKNEEYLETGSEQDSDIDELKSDEEKYAPMLHDSSDDDDDDEHSASVYDLDLDEDSSKNESSESENSESDMMERVLMGMPPLDPPTLKNTRTNMHEHNHEHEHKREHEHKHERSDDEAAGLAPAESTTNDGQHVSDCDNDDTDEERDDEYEVDKIIAFRRVGKKRGGYEYRTKWRGGEETWEPSSSFKLNEPDGDRSSYLPAYDEFREMMKERKLNKNEVIMSADEGESDKDESCSTDDEKKYDENDVVDREMMNSVANRIRILKTIAKGGHDVPENRREAMRSSMWNEFNKAERKEMNAFDELDVWELMPKPHGANVVGVRWVYDIKIDEDGKILRHKARLVAQGFSQKEGIDFTETFAPTMHIKTARVLLAIAAKHKMSCRQYDVSTAFLHASLKEEVYVKQPPGHRIPGKEGWVYRLNEAMYGLKNAPKAYSDHFMSVLSELGFTQSTRDECLWILKKGGARVYYLFHVDDILCVSNDNSVRDVCFERMRRSLRIRDEGEPKMFLGMKISRDVSGGFRMSQKHYIERMAKKFNIDENAKDVETPGRYGFKLMDDMRPKNEDERIATAKLPFQCVVGGLIYTVKTRPDVAYHVSDVARFMSDWGVEHFKAAMRILRYLYSTRDLCLCIMPDDNDMTLSCYVDANWGDDRDSGKKIDDKWKSQYGYAVYVNNCLVSWCSKRQQSRALSSMEAEYYAASEASKEVIHFRELMSELDHEQKNATIMYEDNKACVAFSKNNTCHTRTKHIDIRAYALRDCVKKGVIDVVHVATKYQLADMFTKTQLKHTFMTHKKKMMMGMNECPLVSTMKRKVGMCVCLSCFVGGAAAITA